VVMKSSLFWDIMPLSSVQVKQRFGGTCPLHQFLFKFLWMGWDWVRLVCRPLFGLLYHPQMMVDDGCGGVSGMSGKGNRSTPRKPAPMSLFPPHVPHELTRARTQVAAAGSRRLTTWATARPIVKFEEWAREETSMKQHCSSETPVHWQEIHGVIAQKIRLLGRLLI
jgi:hypothetical protein